MNDLFSRLAARVVGTATAWAGPRPVPRFGEDDQADAPDVHAVPTRDAGPPIPLPRGPTAPLAPPVQLATGQQARAHPIVDPPDRGQVRAGPEPTLPAAVSRSARAGPEPTTARDRPMQSGDEPPAGEAAPPIDGGPPTRAEPVVTRAEPGVTRVEPIVVAAPASLPRSLPDTPVPARPRPADTSADVTAGDTDGTAVHVHIGRLEVRAVPEPSAPRRHRQRPLEPEVSLAEYLRGHRGDP